MSSVDYGRATKSLTQSQRAEVTARGIDAEQLAKAIGALAIAFYVVGLLATNGYLFSLGVSDFSVLRPRFIYTGALVVLSGVLAYALPFLAFSTAWRLNKIERVIDAHRKQSGDIETKRTYSRLSFVALFGTASWAILLVPTMLVVLFQMGTTGASWLQIAPVPIGVSVAGVVAGFSIHFTWSLSNRVISGARHIRGKLDEDESRAVRLFPTLSSIFNYRIMFGIAVASLALITSLAFALYTSIFMRNAYPRIPPQFGGGRPEKVQLVIEDDKTPSIRQIGIQVPAKGTVSEPVLLLYQGSEVYVLRLTEQRVVQIDKRLAPGLIVDRKNGQP
jgi:hypothetical protein